MQILRERFDERHAEVSSYLEFLKGIDAAVQAGIPKIGGDDGLTITTQQQKILYSGVYLQLYNLVEATITECLDYISKASMEHATHSPADLSLEMRREWVKHIARTNVEMGPEKRLENALVLCNHLVDALPVDAFDIVRGGGGNWDDKHIEKIATRLGFKIKVSKSVRAAVKKSVRDDMGALALIVSLRNKLAHGSLTFAECGQNDTALELVSLANGVTDYLREVVVAFGNYLQNRLYLLPERRPNTAVATA